MDTLRAENLKLLPFPKFVRLYGRYVTCAPFCTRTSAGINRFIPETGNSEVRFVEDKTLEQEGYTLSISEKGAEICFSDYGGKLYGAIALNQLCAQFKDRLPILDIADAPIVKHRGAQVCYAQINVAYKAEWLEKHIVELAKLHINYLYLYLEWDFAFPSLPPVCPPDMMTPEDASRLVAFAKEYNIKIVPECNVLGHTADFLAMQLTNDLKENMDGEESVKTSAGMALCPNNPKANEVVFRALEDIVEAFEPEIIHIGGDEVARIGGDRYCKNQFSEKGRIGVLLSYFIKIRNFLSSKGVTTGIWGDMLLALSEENRYDGSFCEEKYREENLRLFEDLKKNTLIYDWWYVGESEKSIRFFSEKGFDVVSTASVHGCMTSIPSFDQQKNIQKLFKDAVKHKVKGGLVSDWIYGFGYHAEQTYFNVAAAAAMLWSGTDENCFISGVSREKFEKDYLFIRYRTEDDSLLRYFHAAGDLKGKLLGLFAPNRKGVALRKAVFYTDNPLWCYVKYIADLDGKLDEYAAAVENIDRLYASAEKSCYDDGWFRALKISVVVHDYVLRTMRTMDEFYARYDAAAKAQYTDEKAFAENLDECAKILFSLRSIYAQPIRFAKWVHEKLGLEESSIYRLRATRRNLQKLVRFIERLKENYRPLPSVSRLSESLFDTDRDTWWKMRDYEWIREEGEFKKYDVDLCQFYESLDWDV